MKNISLFATAVFLFFATAVASAQLNHEPGQLIVQIKQTEKLPELLRDYQQISLKLNRPLSELMHFYLLDFDPAAPEDRVLESLRADKRVALAQFNHQVHLRETLPDDPGLDNQWHHVNNGSGAFEDADIDSDLAWDITTGGLTANGDTIVVCVLESGNLNHPDLQANAWKNYNEIPNNGIDDDNNGYVDDYLGWNVASGNDNNLFNGPHGSSVLGMIGATGDNGTGVVGANWNVKMMVVDGFNAGNEATVVEAYNYPLQMRKLYNQTNGEAGAFVVATNASWGLDFANPADVPLWAAFYDTLGVYGILNCAATTNTNTNVDEMGDIPTAVESDYMIAVTATNNQDNRTFSGYGVHAIDLGAPGENVYTTSQSGYTTTSGTSFASPLTAGVIGLLYSVPCSAFSNFVHSNPQGAADLVKAALLAGVDMTGNLFNQTRSGGRLNAYNSLLQLLDNCNDLSCVNPHGLNYQYVAGTDYNITWYAPNDSSSYALRYRISGDENDWTVLTAFTDTFATVEALAYCTDYEFQITTECGAIEDYNWSQSIHFETTGCCEPTSGNEVLAYDTAHATISWDPIVSANAYEVYIKPQDSEEYILLDTFAGPPVVIPDLTACEDYTAIVKPLCGTDLQLSALTEINFTTDGCCEPTAGNAIENITETGATAVWEDLAATNLYEVYISETEDGNYLLAGEVNGSQFQFSGLEACTTYFVKIKPLCEGDLDLADLPAVSFYTSGCGFCAEAEYCSTGAEDSGDEHIAAIQVGDYEISSGNDGGYILRPATGWELALGQTYEFSATPGFSGWAYEEYFKVWIDLDTDGNFESSEVVFDAGTGSASTVSGDLTIPEDAVLGSTRMRVSMAYAGFANSPPPICGTFSYGEVEDICITLLSPTSAGHPLSQNKTARIYPNPASDQLIIELNNMAGSQDARLEIYDAAGRLVVSDRLPNKLTQLTLKLESGIYLCKISNPSGLLQVEKLLVE